MAILDNPEDFVSGENVTAAKLNNLVDGAIFLGGAGQATDDSTLEVNDGVGGDGSLRVKDAGITTAKLADGAVSTQKIADSAVTSGKIADGAIIASKIAPSAASAIMPPGGLIPYAGATVPSGWLLCDGSTIGGVDSGAGSESADYQTLFDLIKTLYGNSGIKVFASGDTVLLPDLRGRVVAGFGESLLGSGADILGRIGGNKEHTLTEAEMPSHQHKTDGDDNGNIHPVRAGSDAGIDGTSQTASANDARYETGSLTGTAGSGQAHNNVQPTIILNYIIKY